jgi:hypothetical protein
MHDKQKGIAGEAASAAGATVGMGAAATVAAVSACCAGPALGPLVVSLFGAGGAVALEGLRPYSAPLLVLSGLAIGASLWMNARNAKRCSSDRPSRVVRGISRTLSFVSSAVWLAAVAAVVWARLA